ncbi:hypothetical protein [Paenibacillus sp. YN15]|uniref:hypothetical protein n=1 Tax=Paenibacillus sp. YN15 TaxID=1742774 RepID=UPI000DCCA883|nr:hypothetical protein [Paenibacillus sp. YN15]RAV04542.1 hypothetical protein DQG13_04805 [Paenibacillus sp. YN15]
MRGLKQGITSGMIGLCLCLAVGCSGAAGLQMTTDADRGERLLVRALSELGKERVTARAAEAEIVADGIVLSAVPPQVLASTWGQWSADYREAIKLVQLMDRSVAIQKPADSLPATTLVVSLEQEAWSRTMKEGLEERLASLRRVTEELENPQILAAAQKSLGTLEEAIGSLSAEGSCTIRLNQATGRPERLIMESRMIYEESGEARGETVRTIYDF